MRSAKSIGLFTMMGILFILGISIIRNHTTHAEDESLPGGRPPVSIEAITISPQTLFDSVEVVGTLSAKVQTDVKAEYGGVVREVLVKEWVRVKKGDRLLSLDTREPEAMLNKAKAALEMEKANLLMADVAAKRAEREYRRVLQLKESGLATSQSVDEAGTSRDAALAQKASVAARLLASEQDLAQARLRHGKTVITSPIDGIVAERNISEGDLAKDMPLFKIVDNRILDLTVTVPSRFLRFLKPGLPLHFTTDAFPGKTFTGSLKYINPVINETDRSVKVIAEVQNETETLQGGLFVEGRIVTGEREGVLIVPRNTLINWNMANKKAELLLVVDGVAAKKSVEVGITQEDMVEITKGVSAGDEVILRGGFNIKEGDAVIKNGGK
jgi:RND family efflux transporter MFP subunit